MNVDRKLQNIGRNPGYIIYRQEDTGGRNSKPIDNNLMMNEYPFKNYGKVESDRSLVFKFVIVYYG